MSDTASSRDGCVVPTAPLSAAVTAFVKGWNRDRPPTAGRYSSARSSASIEPVSAIEWLSTETRIPVGTLHRIRYNRSRLTELRVADPIVCAMNQTHLLYDGTLPVIPNPKAKAELRAACCGGSLGGFSSLTGLA